MAKDKQKQENKPKGRGEVAMMRALLQKAKRVAKSCGRPTLEAYVASHTALKVYFPKDIARLMATTWTPKPKAKPVAATA
jgi:hypothetical protein